MGALEAIILNQVDVKLSVMQRTLLQAVATSQKLTLMQKAAMDETTYAFIYKSGNNYIITDLLDLTTWDELDPGADLTVTASKITATAFARDAGAANVSESIDGSGNFSIDFEYYLSAFSGQNFGMAAGVGTAINDYYKGAGTTSLVLWPNDLTVFYFSKWLASVETRAPGSITTVGSTLYYCTLSRSGTTVTLSMFTNAARTVHATGSPLSFTEAVTTNYTKIVMVWNSGDVGLTDTGYIQNVSTWVPLSLSANLKSNAITKDANIGLRYWGDIVANFLAGTTGSTIAAKICNSAGTPLHSNFVTIASAEYARIPLERPVVLTATSESQTVWNFTSLTNADAFINELGVLAKALLVELALDGTNYTVLKETTDFSEDISNILAPKITLVSGAGIVNGTSKLRATYIVNIPLSNTTIKMQVQLNRLAGGDTSPSIQPLVGDATKYIGAGQVAII